VLLMSVGPNRAACGAASGKHEVFGFTHSLTYPIVTFMFAGFVAVYIIRHLTGAF